MSTGDGLLIRLRPRGGRLHADEARAIAAQSQALGNGQMELTSRGNLQLRGFTPDSARAFAEFAVAMGLADRDPLRERLRMAILLPPLAGQSARNAAVALEHALVAEAAFHALPDKFALRLDCPDGLPIVSLPVDVAVSPRDGSWSIVAILEALRAWLAPPVSRFRSGLAEAPPVIGWLPDRACLGVGVPFGALPAGRLDALAMLAGFHGDGWLHLTPWRGILLCGIPERVADAIPPDLITDPTDPRLRVSACVGAPGCASASTDTRADGLKLAPGLPAGIRLHVSGCAKRCAHPVDADVTLVADEGRYVMLGDGQRTDTVGLLQALSGD